MDFLDHTISFIQYVLYKYVISWYEFGTSVVLVWYNYRS